MVNSKPYIDYLQDKRTYLNKSDLTFQQEYMGAWEITKSRDKNDSTVSSSSTNYLDTKKITFQEIMTGNKPQKKRTIRFYDNQEQSSLINFILNSKDSFIRQYGMEPNLLMLGQEPRQMIRQQFNGGYSVYNANYQEAGKGCSIFGYKIKFTRKKHEVLFALVVAP